MPLMPVKAAGWRIEPPVSVPVTPGARPAATAAAEPPDDPPGSARHCRRRCASSASDRAVGAGLVGRAHGELVHVELAQHPRARRLEVAGDGALVGRLEALEDVRARGAVDAFGREQILDAERDAGAASTIGRAIAIGRVGRGQRQLRRLDGIGVERRPATTAALNASAISRAEKSPRESLRAAR